MVFGKIFNYDDFVVDRNLGLKLNKVDEKMWNFWKEIFNENFLKVGVMFWGDLFYDFLIFLIKEEVWVFLIKIVSINFDYVEIEGLFDELRKFKIKIYLMVNEREGL